MIFDKKSDNSIGLILSNHLINLMNGKIDVSSTYNEGSTFTVTIDQKIIAEHEEKKEKFLEYIEKLSRLDEKYQLTVAEAEEQKRFIDCLYKKLEVYELKKELIGLVFEYRYYNCIPIENKKVEDNLLKVIDALNVTAKKSLLSLQNTSENPHINDPIIKNLYNSLLF